LPTYYFASGICFVPLSRNILEMGDGDFENMYVWEDSCYLADASKNNPDEQIIMISEILDSEATEGYENFRYTIITKINDKTINNIYDVIDDIENNKKEKHEITTFKNSTLVVKNMSADEHAKILKLHMIHRDRSDDLMPDVIKSIQNKSDDIIIDTGK